MFELRCFGQVTVVDDAGLERRLRSRKHLGLLVYLLAHPRTTHPREDLAYLLWDGTGSKARHSLSQALYDIRSNVDGVMDVSSTSVRIRPGRILYHAEAFERAVESGDHNRALDLYHGEFAPDLQGLGVETFDRWVDAEREHCRVLASLGLRNAQRAAEERGDWDRMCLASLHLVQMNEFDEEAHCALMRGLWMKGDPASALRHYRVLSGDLTATWALARDLAERIESSGSVREVLTVPRRPTEIVGRYEEFGRLCRLVRQKRSTGGVIAVCGEPGVGKSVLLGELARVFEARGGTVHWPSPEQGESHTIEWAGDPQLLIFESNAGSWTRLLEGTESATVTVLSTEDSASVAEADKCNQLAGVVYLNRLGGKHMRALLTLRCPSIDSDLREASVRLSGGNPGLALEMARSGGPIETTRPVSDRALARKALRSSARLRQVVQSRLDALTPSEREAAEVVAVLGATASARIDGVVVDLGLKVGFERLADRGWFRSVGDRIRLAHPLLAHALELDMRSEGMASVRRRVADSLQKGSPEDGLAAATELVELGDLQTASTIASKAAVAAMAKGDNVVAGRAARLATRAARSVRDRFSNGLMACEAELALGRCVEAERIARQIADFAPTPAGQLDAHTLLLRSLLDRGAAGQASQETDRLVSLVAEVGDSQRQVLADLQLAEIELCIAESEENFPRGLQASASLEDSLRAGHPSETGPQAWVQGFRALFSFRLVHVGPRSGEELLLGFGAQLASSTGSVRRTGELLRSVLELRAGRLHTAADMSRAILARGRNRPDRETASALNNLGVALTEAGDFGAAQEQFARLESIDSRLRPPVIPRLNSQFNRAQVAWFSGEYEQAERLAVEATETAELNGAAHHESLGLATLGLLALGQSHVSKACLLDERLSGLAGSEAASHDQYLICWFRGAVVRAQGGDATEQLVAAAAALRQTDPLASLKLTLVADAFRTTGTPIPGVPEARRGLRTMGGGWFVRRLPVWCT